MDCFRSQGQAHIIFFGINSAEDYRTAKELGADGVMVDSPAQAKTGSKIKGRESGLKKRSAVGALENALLLALRLAGETFLRASHGSGQSQTFSSPSEEIPPQLP